jgi:energy-coupling factor transport system permease protein
MDRLLVMLKRLRWLMLAIVLVYGWWTPGAALFPVAGVLSPTVEGLQLGLIRMLVLVIIVSAVHLLLQRTERAQLLAALMQLFTPLCSLQGRSRIAVRIVLSMEAVGQIQPLLLKALSGRSLANKRLTGLGNVAADVYETVLDKAGRAKCDSINVVEAAQPAYWQWLIPLLLAAAIFLLF